MIKRIMPVLVSVGSILGMVLAFFIPSIQDQWDRYQSRNVVQQYVEMGDDFVKEQNYKLAEAAFTKAYDLSDSRRLDIEVKRLNARVSSIYQDPVWGSVPEKLEDVDFEFLLHLQKQPGQSKERAFILTGYCIFLAARGEMDASRKAIDEAIRLNPNEVLAYVCLGNLLDQTNKKTEAEQAYHKAISIDAKNIHAHYNLGLLYAEQGELEKAKEEFNIVLKLNPREKDALIQRDLVAAEMKKSGS
jgi:tetratricopeptide (TPR) repeat protein